MEKKGAWGRVETTSKTDEHQLEGPRNDDNVSLSRFNDGGSIIIETDGAGSGGKASAILSHELNKALNAKLSEKYNKLSIIARSYELESNPEKKEGLRKQLEKELKEIGNGAFRAAKFAIEKEDLNDKGETTLSLVINVPTTEGRSFSFGLQNHDSLSVSWNPETGNFEYDTAHIEKSQTQIQARTNDSIDKSTFFIHENDGPRIDIALSDGVLDNLPGEELDIEKKLTLLNDIILNPLFDSPIDLTQYPSSFVQSAKQIRELGGATRSDPKTITPETIRNRILNYTFWATDKRRTEEGAYDKYQELYFANNQVQQVKHKLKLAAGTKIDKALYEKLPEEKKENINPNDYSVINDFSVNTLIIPKSQLEEFPQDFIHHAPFVEHVPDKAVNALKEEYQKRDLTYGNDGLVMIIHDTINNDIIGPRGKRTRLEQAQKMDPTAFSTKSDGVSVVAVSVG